MSTTTRHSLVSCGDCPIAFTGNEYITILQNGSGIIILEWNGAYDNVELVEYQFAYFDDENIFDIDNGTNPSSQRWRDGWNSDFSIPYFGAIDF